MTPIALALALGMAAVKAERPVALEPADLVVRNARVVTLDPGRPEAGAFAVAKGRFVAVGGDEEVARRIGPATRVMDARGATVVPGLIDAHLHLIGEGYRLELVDLVGTRSRDEAVGRVRDAARSGGAGWLRGRGWDQNDWPVMAYPSAADLDAVVRERPVYLRRVDGHAAWVNTRALAVAGIDAATPNPPGGRILRDAAGRPTGILIDNAVDLVAARMPPPSREERLRAIRRAAAACVAAGLTGVHEPGVDLDDVAALEEVAGKGELPLRVYAMVNPGPALDHYLKGGPVVGAFDGRLTVRALKLYADGALGSRGAALLEDYADEAGNRGLQLTATEELERQAGRAAAAGFQPAVHAIGDRGNRVVLDLYQRLAARVPGFAALRARVEHVQVLALDDIPRFAALGVVASMQPTHATSDGPWAEARLGPERIRGAYAWSKLLSSGARLAFGSDAPVESVRPMLGIYAARTRQDADGKPPDGWQPSEKLSGEDALRAFTLGAAFAAHEEKDKGSIEAGKLADFVLLSGDPRRVPARELLSLRVLSTWVGGKAVYEAGP